MVKNSSLSPMRLKYAHTHTNIHAWIFVYGMEFCTFLNKFLIINIIIFFYSINRNSLSFTREFLASYSWWKYHGKKLETNSSHTHTHKHEYEFCSDDKQPLMGHHLPFVWLIELIDRDQIVECVYCFHSQWQDKTKNRWAVWCFFSIFIEQKKTPTHTHITCFFYLYLFITNDDDDGSFFIFIFVCLSFKQQVLSCVCDTHTHKD